MVVINSGRKIIHIDMDAFYASIEQRDQPELRGKPIAVGGSGARGVVATASYEARKFGVHSAMSSFRAQQLCPQLIFVPARFDVYREVSRQIRAIFEEYTDLIEPLSLDEAYLDVTSNKKQEPIATIIAQQIITQVYEQTQLTCSAGVSYCKFIAKIASDIKKPNGLTVIKPQQAIAFLEKLPVKKFHGVGKVTAARMQSLGLKTGADLKQLSKLELAQHFGKVGRFYYDIVRGIDNRPVNTNRIRKSLAVERTFKDDLSTFDEIVEVLEPIILKFFERLTKADNFGRTITLKLKTSDFQLMTRSLSKEHFITSLDEIRTVAHTLLKENIDDFEKIRLIGLTASNLQKQEDTFGIGYQLKFDFP
ncbi:DNA polymerase IV [Aureispira anguillae]|uniref:DNA polymerase IV n=1 Tax=Aureispira anguillae TaxID=2864201 RepID=A0A916DVN6_9BACT|nr:DNA polymerase IV [Aureispira anguillae]BDS14571.1 DNA polymerase IV [Aureispira anguillae]